MEDQNKKKRFNPLVNVLERKKKEERPFVK